MLLKVAPSRVRQRTISAAAAFSGSLAAFCLSSAWVSARPGPAFGCFAATVAAAALIRARRRGPEQESLRLRPQGGVLPEHDGQGEPAFWPVGITRPLICLARDGRNSERRTIWRDGIAPDGFRRIAAFGSWRRGATLNQADSTELIAPGSVRGGQTVPRAGRPRGQ